MTVNLGTGLAHYEKNQKNAYKSLKMIIYTHAHTIAQPKKALQKLLANITDAKTLSDQLVQRST